MGAALAIIGCALAVASPAGAAPADGIHNIQHVVMIMQENRSFDSYFGTYPGANGIPPGVCVPDPLGGHCVKPFHDPLDKNFGGPHGTTNAQADIDGGKMDGFIEQTEKARKCTGTNPSCGCDVTNQAQCDEVMGYHDAREIPNYWEYAHQFVLQDNMFESAISWSLPEHRYMVSAWAGSCPLEDPNPMDCSQGLNSLSRNAAWTDISYLLYRAHVSWAYYVGEGTEPDCESDETVVCKPRAGIGPKTPSIWNPLLQFADVKEDGQLPNIQSQDNFFKAVHETAGCPLPNVSWIDPYGGVSEHPAASVAKGQAYVTTLVNAVMRSPCWNSTAIFISWDDWGGLYDHVMPPGIDKNGYGLRVPGLVISPYAKAGYIDHQQLSHDAYLKFIEDDFLNGERLNPLTDGRPDPRGDVREEVAGLGDLRNDFDFSQAPRPPVLLSPHPEPGPASEPPASIEVETGGASGVTQGSASLAGTVNPNGGAVSDCRFEYGASVAYGSSVPCSSLPGSGTSPVAVSAVLSGLSANSTYHFRLVAANAGGSSVGGDATFTTLPEPPVVETGGASGVTQGSASLAGTVNPNGGAVSDCRFEYGASVAYGSSVPCSSLPGSGTSPVAVSAVLSGLSANTTYHFRLVAANAGGSSVGGDATFTTAETLPVFGRCAKVPAEGPSKLHHGLYADSGCVTKAESATGEYEWSSAAVKAGFNVAGETTTLETVARNKIVCVAQSGAGEITGATTATLTERLLGCARGDGASCQSEAAASGEIRLTSLAGRLGFIRNQVIEGKPQVSAGLLLEAGSAEPYVATFLCGGSLEAMGVQTVVTGSVIATVSAIDAMSLKHRLTYTAVRGVQRPESFEGGPAQILLSSTAGEPSEPIGLTAASTLTGEERLEIKAIP